MAYSAQSRQVRVHTSAHSALSHAVSTVFAVQMGFTGTDDSGYLQACKDIARHNSPDGGFEGFITYGETREFMNSARPLIRAWHIAFSQRCLNEGEADLLFRGERVRKLCRSMTEQEQGTVWSHWSDTMLGALNDIGYTDEMVDILDQFYYAAACDVLFEVACVESGVMGG